MANRPSHPGGPMVGWAREWPAVGTAWRRRPSPQNLASSGFFAASGEAGSDQRRPALRAPQGSSGRRRGRGVTGQKGSDQGLGVVLQIGGAGEQVVGSGGEQPPLIGVALAGPLRAVEMGR